VTSGPAVRRELHIGAAEREQGYYQYVPFSVGTGWRSVRVQVSYDHTEAVLDVGLIGPGGFRGWSGGERSTVSVAERWATPGYLPGRLPGEWAVMLALYQLPDGGVDVTVSAGPGDGPPRPAAPDPDVPTDVPFLSRPPARPGSRWVAGDLHCHSEHSDGALSVAELAALARGRGLDFLAVTDHNTVSHFPFLEAAGRRYGLRLVPGQEVTTPKGHANCLGPVGWADFRTPPDTWMAKAEAEGGLTSVNHPVLGSLSWRMSMSHRVPLMELWHQSWDRRDGASFAFWASLGAPVPIGGSDFHRHGELDGVGLPRLPGSPTTWVEVPADDGPCPSVASVMDGLRRRAVSISASPDSPVVVRTDDELVVCNGEGATLVALEAPGQLLSQGRPLAVISGKAHMDNCPGPAVLLGAGKVLAICPQGPP